MKSRIVSPKILKKTLLVAAFSFASIPLFSAENSIWPLPKEVEKFDKNHDNVLSGNELVPEVEKYDLNGDGTVVPAEIHYFQARERLKKNHPFYDEPKFPEYKVAVPEAPKAVKKALLVSIDGLDRRVLMELIGIGAVPNLVRLADSSGAGRVIVNSTLPDYPTNTKPGHAAMLTSLPPHKNRVLTSTMFQPIPKGLTILERVKLAPEGEKIRTVFVSSKQENVGGMTAEELGNRVEHGMKIEGGPYLNLRNGGVDIFDATDKTPEEAKIAFLAALEKVKDEPFLAFLHFRDPDKHGHAYGRESEWYRTACRDVDKQLGEIFDALEHYGIFDDVRIFVTADHGFNPESHGHDFAPWIALISNDPSVYKAEGISSYDVPATILSGFGVDLEKLDPPLEGKNLSEKSK